MRCPYIFRPQSPLQSQLTHQTPMYTPFADTSVSPPRTLPIPPLHSRPPASPIPVPSPAAPPTIPRPYSDHHKGLVSTHSRVTIPPWSQTSILDTHTVPLWQTVLSNTPVEYWGRPTSSVEPPCPSHRHTNDEPTIRPIGFLHDALGQCVGAGHRGVEDGQMRVSGIECVSGGWREGGGVGGQTMTMKTRR